jgi:hypothetical protein
MNSEPCLALRGFARLELAIVSRAAMETKNRPQISCRGDLRESIFHDAAYRQRFIETLGKACGKTGWLVHA